MKLRYTRVVAAWVVLAGLGLAGCAEQGGASTGSATEDDGPIRIGAVLDITGAGASLAEPELKTLELLVAEVNDAGGIDGQQVELLVEDNQSLEDGAARAMTKLINEEEVSLIIGSSRSGTSLAMRSIAESSGTPMISLAANINIVDGSEWVFKTPHNDRVVLEAIVDLAADQGWETLGLVRDASGYGEGVDDALSEIGAEQGVELVRTEKFAPDVTDFTAQMVNIRDAGADANVVWGIPPAAALAQKAYDQLGIEAPTVQSTGIANQSFLDLAGDSAEGMLAPLPKMLVADQLPDDDPQKDVVQQFAAAYADAHGGEQASTFAGYAHDAFSLAVDAIDEVGTDRESIRDHLEQVEGFVGVTGVFTMSPDDHNGLDKDSLAIVTVEDGAWASAAAN